MVTATASGIARKVLSPLLIGPLVKIYHTLAVELARRFVGDRTVMSVFFHKLQELVRFDIQG
jgi:hypothetical protein